MSDTALEAEDDIKVEIRGAYRTNRVPFTSDFTLQPFTDCVRQRTSNCLSPGSRRGPLGQCGSLKYLQWLPLLGILRRDLPRLGLLKPSRGTRVITVLVWGEQPVLVEDHHTSDSQVSLFFWQRLTRIPSVVGEVSESQPNR